MSRSSAAASSASPPRARCWSASPRCPSCSARKKPSSRPTRPGTTAGSSTRASTTSPAPTRPSSACEGKGLCASSARPTGSGTTAAARSSSPPAQDELPRLQTLYERGIANGVPGVEMIDASAPARDRAARPRLCAPSTRRTTAIVDYGAVSAAHSRRELTARGVDHRAERRRCWRSSAYAGRARDRHLATRRRPRVARQLRRALLRRGRAPGRRRARACRSSRSAASTTCSARATPSRARPDLPGARSRVPVPRRALHATPSTARWRPDRTRCWPSRARATAAGRAQPARAARDPALPRLLAHGAQVLAHRRVRGVPLAVSKAAFVHALQRLVPEIKPEDVTAGRRRGARPGRRPRRHPGRRLPHRRQSDDAIHVLNAPSPAATASLAIGRHIAGLAVGDLRLR